MTQTFKDFEIIVVDDCSTDNSIELIKKYNDPRIKIYRQIKNSGESSSRNLGIINSTGKYVYFMDDDDAILPNYLETLYNAIEESQSDVVHANSHLIAEDPDFTYNTRFKISPSIDYNPQPRFLASDLYERIKQEYLTCWLNVVPWTKIFRRDFLINSKLYFPPAFLNNDVLLLLGELCFAKKIQVIDARGYIRRQNPNSTMHQPTEIKLRRAIESLPVATEFVRNILSSTNLSLEFRRIVESEAITRYFKIYVTNSYKGELKFEQIDKILDETVYKSVMIDPQLTKTLLHTLGILLSK